MKVNPVHATSNDLYWSYKRKEESKKRKKKQTTYTEVEHKIDVKA